jgi:hypothetical protein
MAFLGNKADLKKDRAFGLSELESLANETLSKSMISGCFLTSAKTGDSVDDAFYKIADIMRHITINAKEIVPQQIVDKDNVNTLVDVVDHIVADFSNQFGGLENATPIIKRQMEKVGLDLENPTYKAVVEFINGLANAERSFKSPDDINMNRTKRLYMVNLVKEKK